jgi:SAM-dependent methyltransferase
MRRSIHPLAVALLVTALSGIAAAQQPSTTPSQEPYQPRIGQAGKDVVWVPTPPSLLDLMLDMAEVTKDDFVMDLGSGDGRNIIAAAKRGARGVGVEYNPDMVALSRRLAREAGVGDLATFVQGDMYEADISKATVMAVFLLPANMEKLLPTFKTLAPGSRIVSNTFGFEEWDPDARATVRDGACADWCEALLWIVPAQAAGTWSLDEGSGSGLLKLTQLHQVLYGTLSDTGGDRPIAKARMRGYGVSFTIGDRVYTGRLKGEVMEGTVIGPDGSRPWRAQKIKPIANQGIW